jgi:hypothetical protein
MVNKHFLTGGKMSKESQESGHILPGISAEVISRARELFGAGGTTEIVAAYDFLSGSDLAGNSVSVVFEALFSSHVSDLNLILAGRDMEEGDSAPASAGNSDEDYSVDGEDNIPSDAVGIADDLAAGALTRAISVPSESEEAAAEAEVVAAAPVTEEAAAEAEVVAATPAAEEAAAEAEVVAAAPAAEEAAAEDEVVAATPAAEEAAAEAEVVAAAPVAEEAAAEAEVVAAAPVAEEAAAEAAADEDEDILAAPTDQDLYRNQLSDSVISNTLAGEGEIPLSGEVSSGDA